MDGRLWFAFFLLMLAVSIVMIATLLDFVFAKDKTRYVHLRCFSFTSNISRLFRIQTKSVGTLAEIEEKKRFEFIHGLRVIASWFIFIAHNGGLVIVQYKLNVQYFARHPKDMIDSSRMLAIQPFYNGGLIIFLFSMMSGMLTFYHSASPHGFKLSFAKYFALRLLRYYPVILGANLLITIPMLLGSGPLFHRELVYPLGSGCYDTLGYELLFLKSTQSMSEPVSLESRSFVGINVVA